MFNPIGVAAMSGIHAAIAFSRLHHLVFSTKGHQPWLRDKGVREELCAQLGGISKTLEYAPLLVGGVEDHVHLLGRFGRSITQAEWSVHT
jgi:hypothetical protein